MRDLKRDHRYSLDEQEGMLPFERDILLDKITDEVLKSADTPREGWKTYAENIGATQKTRYTDKFTVLDSPVGPTR